MAFDVGAVSFRDATRAITNPESMIEKFYQENIKSGMGKDESAFIALNVYKQVAPVIYQNALAIVEAFESYNFK